MYKFMRYVLGRKNWVLWFICGGGGWGMRGDLGFLVWGSMLFIKISYKGRE